MNTKNWWESKTIWASFVSMLITVLGLIHVSISSATGADVTTWLATAGTLITSAIAIYGRAKATTVISPAASSKPSGTSLNAIILALLFPAFFLLSLLSGCAQLSAPTPAFVTADQATYSAIAPEYSAYVAADASLTPEQKQRRVDTVATWNLRLQQESAVPAVSPSNPPSSQP
jgi:hypothetical protein